MPEQTVEQIVKLPVIWHAMTFMWLRCNALLCVTQNDVITDTRLKIIF